jgi:hypothetical protein
VIATNHEPEFKKKLLKLKELKLKYEANDNRNEANIANIDRLIKELQKQESESCPENVD